MSASNLLILVLVSKLMKLFLSGTTIPAAPLHTPLDQQDLSGWMVEMKYPVT